MKIRLVEHSVVDFLSPFAADEAGCNISVIFFPGPDTDTDTQPFRTKIHKEVYDVI